MGFRLRARKNSILLSFGNEVMEIPSLNIVFFQPENLLGKAVYKSFGDEFPIRFDFLDTMEGGNLSLQVHPLKEYIREKFGIVTQDEVIISWMQKKSICISRPERKHCAKTMLNELQHAQSDGGF